MMRVADATAAANRRLGWILFGIFAALTAFSLAFIVFESMLFAGLLGGYVVLRWGNKPWPPPGQPYLPIGVTWLNTAVLLGSIAPLTAAGRAYRRGARAPFARALVLTALLGSL